MQAKRFARINEETVSAGAGGNVDITQTSFRKSNFHGIRAQGRIRADNVSADNEAHGIVALLCKSQEYTIPETLVDSDSNLEDLSEQIIAIMPWAVYGGSSNPVGGGTYFDFDIHVKSSRTCTKGMELYLGVYNYAESAKSVIISQMLLQAFETQA